MSPASFLDGDPAVLQVSVTKFLFTGQGYSPVLNPQSGGAKDESGPALPYDLSSKSGPASSKRHKPA